MPAKTGIKRSHNYYKKVFNTALRTMTDMVKAFARQETFLLHRIKELEKEKEDEQISIKTLSKPNVVSVDDIEDLLKDLVLIDGYEDLKDYTKEMKDIAEKIHNLITKGEEK